MQVDFSQLDIGTRTKMDEILRGRYDALLARACRRQARLAAINHLHRPLARDGFGQKLIELDPVFDAHWRHYYGADYTANPDLLKFLLKRNPEIAVRSRGTKEIQVGYATGKESRRPVGYGRTVQTYGTNLSGALGDRALP